jgi:hypothetical protein
VTGRARDGLRRLVTLSWRDQLLVARIAVLLGVAELGVRLLPLPAIARRFGVPLSTEPSAPLTGNPWARLSASERHRLLVLQRAAERWPFGNGPCLRESLVQGRLLRRHRPVLRIGVGTDDTGIIGHAWIEVDGHGLGEAPGFLAFEGAPGTG